MPVTDMRVIDMVTQERMMAEMFKPRKRAFTTALIQVKGIDKAQSYMVPAETVLAPGDRVVVPLDDQMSDIEIGEVLSVDEVADQNATLLVIAIVDHGMIKESKETTAKRMEDLALPATEEITDPGLPTIEIKP